MTDRVTDKMVTAYLVRLSAHLVAKQPTLNNRLSMGVEADRYVLEIDGQPIGHHLTKSEFYSQIYGMVKLFDAMQDIQNGVWLQ